MALKRVNISEISELIKNNKIEENEIFEKIVFEKICSKWSEIVGPVLEKNIFPRNFFHGCLIISSTHPAYKQEAMFLSGKIIKEVNSFYNKKVLEKIIFKTFHASPKKFTKKEY